ncbi:MotA/TolQ/ExbB proton channel family protein [Photobacterium damselae]|uniref:MotA/TolQ/ExbB proton channel family protein n=1 Tax=Photobacterium damselae TaxID=38293 RepID=UPI004068AA70
MIDNIISFFEKGGVYMLPIGFVAVVAVAIFLERLCFLIYCNYQLSKQKNLIDFNSLKLESELKKYKSLLSILILDALNDFNKYKVSKSQFEERIETSSHHVLDLVKKRTTILSTLANIATLLGLLGTIMGLIDSFSSVANATGDKSQVLSSSVSVAMNTTAFGLIVAIPLLLAYLYVDDLSNKILSKINIYCSKIVYNIYHYE